MLQIVHKTETNSDGCQSDMTYISNVPIAAEETNGTEKSSPSV